MLCNWENYYNWIYTAGQEEKAGYVYQLTNALCGQVLVLELVQNGDPSTVKIFFFSLNRTRFHNYSCRREKNSMNCPPIICSHLYYRGVPVYRVGRRWSFLVMCSFQISSRDILPCLCMAVWIMNDCDWGPHWRESSRTKSLLTF